VSDAIVEKGKPLNLEEIADKELVKALLDHHTEGQCKCIQHVMYRYTDGAWISIGERC
jgi:hypothetical protein